MKPNTASRPGSLPPPNRAAALSTRTGAVPRDRGTRAPTGRTGWRNETTEMGVDWGRCMQNPRTAKLSTTRPSSSAHSAHSALQLPRPSRWCRLAVGFNSKGCVGFLFSAQGGVWCYCLPVAQSATHATLPVSITQFPLKMNTFRAHQHLGARGGWVGERVGVYYPL